MAENPSNDTDSAPEPANLRFLRQLVTVLTAVMIAGLLVILALIVIRFTATPEAGIPDTVTLPEGTTPTAFTRGPDWFAIVTADDRILIYASETGELRQIVQIESMALSE